MDDGRNGDRGGTGPQDNVTLREVTDNAAWDTGGEKGTGDAIHDGIYRDVSDANAGAGADTPVMGTAASDDGREASAPAAGQGENAPSYGGYSEGMPASGATTLPEKTVEGEEGS